MAELDVDNEHLREHTCKVCGATWQEPHAVGRYPSKCPACDPEAAERRRYQRDLRRRKHGEVEDLRARIAELEALVAFDDGADARAAAAGEEPGKEAVTRAVRRLAYAEGREETRDRLLDLAGAARSWARALATSHVERERM